MKHATRIKKALEEDAEYAKLKETTEDYKNLIQTVLKIDDQKLKDLIDLEHLEKNDIEYYKKKPAEYAEYYLTFISNRNRAREIYEKENMIDEG